MKIVPSTRNCPEFHQGGGLTGGREEVPGQQPLGTLPVHECRALDL